MPVIASRWGEDEKRIEYSLLPVEIEQQGYSASEGIRFCLWHDSFQGGSFDNQAADKDRDRFRIKIEGNIPNLTKARIKATDLHGAVVNGAFVNKTTDGDYEVEMNLEGGSMVSTPILLVSDGEDDKSYNGKGTDDGTGDQTLLADFESKIVVTLPELSSGEFVFKAQRPTAVIRVNAIYGSVDGTIPSAARNTILLQINKMREIYRAAGIKVELTAINSVTIPAAWLELDRALRKDYIDHLESSTFYGMIRGYPAPAGQMRVGFLDAWLEDPTAIRVGGYSTLGAGPCVVSLKEGANKLNITAHEIGHAVGGLNDVDQSDLNLQYRLMFGEALLWKKGVRDSKRLIESEISSIKDHEYYCIPLR